MSTATAPRTAPSPDIRGGVVVYDGPSMIDGAPILGILTRESSNIKTGKMDQLWILRADMDPQTASRGGDDVAICGGCPHRGHMVDGVLVGRSCYVTLSQGPRTVWDGWVRGIYRAVESLADIRAAGAGRMVRLGAYGDPAAIPAPIVRALVSKASGWTGYTHQWKSARLGGQLRDILQASCDTLQDMARAMARGWSTFTVLPAGAPIPAGAVECANSRTGVTCAECRECDGRGRHHIAIHAHGSGAGHVTRRTLPTLQ